MNCDFCQQRLELYVLGDLDPSVAQSIAEHLESGCIRCGEELAALSDSIDCLIETTELKSPRSSTWDRVAAAIESDQPPNANSPELPIPFGLHEPFSFNSNQIMLGLLAIACGFGLMMLTLRATIDRSVDPSVASKVDTKGQSPIGSTQSQSNLAGEPSSQKKNQNPSQLVSFREPNQPRHVAGSMVVDMESEQIHVHVQMREPHRYAFWFVTNRNEWILGGELDQLSVNHYGKVLDIPATEVPIAYTAITIESADESNSAQRDIALVSDSLSNLKRKSL